LYSQLTIKAFSYIAYGTETIRDLVPKVIRILELLELQAARNEKEADELMEMRTRIERLEIEKSETRELREKFDQELEVIEEQWRKEVSANDARLCSDDSFSLSQADNLMALVSKLEDENRRLRDELQDKNEFNEKLDSPNPKETISRKKCTGSF
jgi:cell division protein FtsB